MTVKLVHMTDKLMRRVWVSPFTALVYAIFCSFSAAAQHGYGFWFWVMWGSAVWGYAVFLGRGRKRWGPK